MIMTLLLQFPAAFGELVDPRRPAPSGRLAPSEVDGMTARDRAHALSDIHLDERDREF